MKDLETLLFFLENNKDYSKLSNFELKEKIDLIIKNLDILAKKYGDNYYISKDFMTEYEQNIKKELISLLFQIKNKKGIVGSYFENYEYQKYENYLLKSEHFGYSFNNLIPELETYSKILVQLK